jgi:protein SCO1/2
MLGIAFGVVLHFTLAPTRSAPALPAFHGQATWPEGARPATNFTLRDQTGRPFSLASLRGRTVALMFFDSHCRAQCPLAGRAFAQAETLLPASQRPVVVVVSVNPADTPTSARAAATRWGLAGAGTWHWTMGTVSQLRAVWHAYGVYVRPTTTDIIHTEATYLIDRRGYERTGYLFPFLPNFVALDLRTLAKGRA